jgi:hypothetical protein
VATATGPPLASGLARLGHTPSAMFHIALLEEHANTHVIENIRHLSLLLEMSSIQLPEASYAMPNIIFAAYLTSRRRFATIPFHARHWVTHLLPCLSQR